MADRSDYQRYSWRGAEDRSRTNDERDRWRDRQNDERRSFGRSGGVEGEDQAWRRDRYGSRYDQDRGVYGSGYDRADYGRGVSDDLDPDYVEWRDRQLRDHDRDYHEWRHTQHRSYDDEYRQFRTERRSHFGQQFHQWRAQRNLAGGLVRTDISPGGGEYAQKTAHAGGIMPYAGYGAPGADYEPPTGQAAHGRGASGPVDAPTEHLTDEPAEVRAVTDGDTKPKLK